MTKSKLTRYFSLSLQNLFFNKDILVFAMQKNRMHKVLNFFYCKVNVTHLYLYHGSTFIIIFHGSTFIEVILFIK